MKGLREPVKRSNRRRLRVTHVLRGLGCEGAFLLLCLPCLGQTKHVSSQVIADSPIVQADSPTTRACGDSDYGLLGTSEAESLLSDYGFDGFIPARCVAVDLSWLPSAQIVQMTALTTAVDDDREITLLRASLNSRLWLIPTANGMVGYPDTPNNPHHLAAFNDLLRIAGLNVTDKNVQDISDLYQFIVGMKVKSNPHPPKTMKNLLSTDNTAGLIEHGKGFIDFTHREAFGDGWSSNYMIWEFRYNTSGRFTRLIDVERMTLKQYKDTD